MVNKHWLVVSKIWIIFPFHVWVVILPIDELIFSRWLKPPIRWGLSMFFVSFGEGPMESHWPTRSNQYTGIRWFFHGSIAIIGYYQQLARFWWYPIFRQTHMLIEESRRYPSVCAVVDSRVYSSQWALLVAKPLVCWGMSPKVRVDSSCLDQSLHKVTQNLYKTVGNTDDTNQLFHSAILQLVLNLLLPEVQWNPTPFCSYVALLAEHIVSACFCKWLWFSWMTIRYNWCLGKFVAGSTDWTTFWFVMLNLTSAWPHSKAFWLGETTAHDGPSAKTY